MLSDVISYGVLVSALVVTSLRPFFAKPNRLEIPIPRPGPAQGERDRDFNSADA
jgi:hypothetical protein